MVIEKVKDYDKEITDPKIYRERRRPIRPGLRIMSGSIGFFVKHEGKYYLVTAAHLLSRFEEGYNYYQPRINTFANNKIGKLSKWIDIYNYEDFAPGDYMAFEVLPGVPFNNELIEANLKPTEIIEPKIGMEVYRVGSTTGQTKAEITALDRTSNFRNWSCENLFRLEPMTVDHGDSGGGIFSIDPPGVLGVNVTHTAGCSAYDALPYLGLGGAKLSNKDVINLKIGKKDFYYNEEKAGKLDVAPYIKEGRTMLELRGIGEVLGLGFDWEPKEGETEDIFLYVEK